MLTPAAKDHSINTMYTGIRAMLGMLTALRSDAMTSGKSVYPMIQTDWKNDLFHVLVSRTRSLSTPGGNPHISSKKLYLERDHCLAYPDNCEDAGKDK